MAKPKTPRRGRPPLAVAEQRRNKISVRVRDDLYTWLEKGVKAGAKPTLSELCESLLQIAFEKAAKGEGYDEFIHLELDRVKRDYEGLRKGYERLGDLVGKVRK